MTIVIEISIICDICFDGWETGCSSEEEAEKYGIKKGWIVIDKKHYCPECKEEAQSTQEVYKKWTKKI